MSWADIYEYFLNEGICARPIIWSLLLQVRLFVDTLWLV